MTTDNANTINRPNIVIRESFVNADTGYQYGETGFYETFTDDTGVLFRELQKEHGRCVSKMYKGNGVPCGWVFQKRQKYEDSPETYTQETWVEVK